jgi:colanic acid/amylovoran biosynthesis glycosyltransferase
MKPKLIYFCSEFPGISHTFIFREIEMLIENGFEILTASVNLPHHLEKMSGREQTLSAQTVYLKKAPFSEIARAIFVGFFRSPLKMVAMAHGAVTLTLIKGPKSLKKALGYFIEAVLLVNAAQKQKVRHVHVHFANPAATVALIASRSGAFQYSLSIHGPDVFYNTETNLLTEKVVEATFVRCISHYCRSQLCRLIPFEDWPKLTIVRCGVDPGVFTPRPVPGNKIPQLLCVGRLTRNKGQHILIEACTRLKDSATPFHVTFVGDGEDRASLERQVSISGLEKEVTFTGAMGQDGVKAIYRTADLFILPSFAEGVPVVLMEAMAMEIPVISTCINGIPELIDSGDNGILVSPGDAEALFLKIKLLIEEPLLRARMGQQARRKVEEAYNLSTNCNQLVSLFEQVLENT